MNNSEIQSREWWAQRWIDLLETSRFKKRLERARNYARQGNVLKIEFTGARVLAQVQGTEVEPYQITLSLDQFTEEQWNYSIETMSQRAIFSARLLAGEMPQNIEEVFTASGLSLYPFTLSEVHSRCSCPDKEVPCKHIGAVYYLLGDRFSEDPFVLFQLRGRTKEQIIETLRQLRSSDAPEESSHQIAEVSAKAEIPTTFSMAEFWQYDQPLDASLVAIIPAPSSETTLEILGTINLGGNTAKTANSKVADAQAVKQYLDAVAQAASQQAVLSAFS